MNSEEHLRRLQWGVAELYKDHKLLDEQYWNNGHGARWLIGRPGTGVMLTEIIAGVHGSLVVHGDCDLSRFAYYSDHRDAWRRLRWMGLCTDVGYYVAQKASIGLARTGSSEAYDEVVAEHDIERYIGELEESDDFDYDKLIGVLREALDSGVTETEQTLRNFLSENDQGWDLWEHTFGRVVATHVVVGHLALQRCTYLLLDKYGPDGPPQCRLPKEDI